MEKTRKHFISHFNGYSMYPFLKPGDYLIAGRVSPKSLQIGDIVLVPDLEKKHVAHRLVKMLPPDKVILKGDSLLEPDSEPAELSILSGKVVAILRKGQLIPLSTGLRSRLKKVYAYLSLNGLTSGAIRLRAKNTLLRLFPSDEPKGHRNEWGFIIETLCNHIDQTATNLDWIRIKKVASEEGVTGILYKKLKDSDIPQSAQTSFKDSYLSIAARNIININALERLEDALNSKQIEVMTLKGASLLDHIYPDIGMRPMGDLDLMVRTEGREGFINLLHGLGYKEHPVFPHILNNDRVIIDLHIHALNTDRIASRADLFPSGIGPIWANSVPWRGGYQWLRRPDHVDNVLLLSQHLMKHSFSKLIWLADILRLIKDNDAVFWNNLLKRADYLHQRRSLSYSLYLLNRIFYHKLEMGLENKDLLFREISRLERGILDARADGESIGLIGPLMAMFCVKGLRKKIALGWESLFPKDEIMKHKTASDFRGKRLSSYVNRLWKIVPSLLRRFRIIFNYIIRV